MGNHMLAYVVRASAWGDEGSAHTFVFTFSNKRSLSIDQTVPSGVPHGNIYDSISILIIHRISSFSLEISIEAF